MWNARWNGRLSHRLILTLTLIAAGLCTVGLYAVTMQTVRQRTAEIGVRMALGARPWHIATMIVRRALVQLAFGFVAGVVCVRLWAGQAPAGSSEPRAADLQTLLIVAAILLGLAALACVVPARRATRLDPTAAIRHQ
jgi:putative ABC transport system permease protein